MRPLQPRARRALCIGLTATAVALQRPVCAWESPDTVPPRPRVGLVLSGGGARGLAHVGVLKVLEELRIPVDFVAGTSMGAVVGGLYALGLSPSEIEQAVLAMDWGDIFSDKPPRAQRTFRRKEDDRAELFDLELGIRGGRVRLPRSALSGQKLAFAFNVPALHTAGTASFDSLPIPFRAIATDIRSGEMVPLSKGSLARTIRASMSVPGAFPPVEIEGRLLVDGGLTRNLPNDVARDMGAEVIIAVDVSEDLSNRTPDELASLLELSLQLVSLMAVTGANSYVPLANVVVRPELGDITMIDFDRTADAILGGAESARDLADTLRSFAVSQADFDRYVENHRGVPSAAVVVDSIAIVNRSHVDPRTIRVRLHTAPGDTFDLGRMRRDLDALYDLGSIELVDFQLRSRHPVDVLEFRVDGKSHGRNLLKLGMVLDGDLVGKSRFEAQVRLTSMDLNAWGAEWRTDARIGTSSGLVSEWYQPLGFRRRWFVAPRLGYTSLLQDLYAGNERIAEYRIQDARIDVDLGVVLARFGELRAGFFFGHVDSNVETGLAPVPEFSDRQAGVAARFAVDLLDDADFPTKGQFGLADLRLSREALGAERSFDRLELQWDGFRSWGETTTFVGAAGGSAFGSQLPTYADFLLGGLGSLSGLQLGQLRGSVFARARAGVYHPLMDEIDLLGTRAYAGVWFEAGNAWRTSSDARGDDLLYTVTLALGLKSVFGPVYLAYGRTDRGDDAVYFTIGRQIGTP
ncbi:MAG: patatin-like phospholipase family protein [Candidatus Latescibacterota bacterium]|nr:MAG: patatin-like phospholipase family protein [Candidatus Latescibacterota bacterium]